MMDCIVPGGVAVDLAPDGVARRCERLLAESASAFPHWSSSTTTPPRCRTAPSAPASSAGARAAVRRRRLCRPRLGPRTSTRGATPAYPPYDELHFDVPVLEDGDVNARVWIRIREVEQSLALVEQILGAAAGRRASAQIDAPRSPAAKAWRSSKAFAATSSPGCGSTADGRIARCHLRDPSWFQWPLLEAAIEGNIVADFPLCNKSFNCSYSGHDL